MADIQASSFKMKAQHIHKSLHGTAGSGVQKDDASGVRPQASIWHLYLNMACNKKNGIKS